MQAKEVGQGRGEREQGIPAGCSVLLTDFRFVRRLLERPRPSVPKTQHHSLADTLEHDICMGTEVSFMPCGRSVGQNLHGSFRAWHVYNSRRVDGDAGAFEFS